MSVLKSIFDTFGAPIFVPVVMFIIAKILGVTTKKSLYTALYAGVGLEGFTLLLNSFTPIITPVVRQMVKGTGVNLPVFDVGWQATALVAYSTNVGMMFLGVGLVLETILFLVKWTDVFQPGDLWNTYSYMVWGSMVYFVTKSVWLSLVCMVVLNLYSLLIAELMANRWSNYYKYPNCTIISMHNIEPAVFAAAIDPLWNKLGFNKIKLNPRTLQDKFGLFGEPIFLGFILGLFIGILGNISALGTLKAWGQITLTGIATSAVMTIFPKVASIFAQAFMPMTQAATKSVSKGAKKRNWFLGINDAAGYGEPATLISGIILIPIMVIVAMILPGNRTLPVVDLVAIPYMVEGIVCLTNGNIFKTIINGVIWFSIGLYMCSYTAPLFTSVAAHSGVTLPAGALLITSFNILGKPLMGLIFLAFLFKNPIGIVISIVLYFVLWFLFRKNKTAVYDYLETNALKNESVEDEE